MQSNPNILKVSSTVTTCAPVTRAKRAHVGFPDMFFMRGAAQICLKCLQQQWKWKHFNSAVNRYFRYLPLAANGLQPKCLHTHPQLRTTGPAQGGKRQLMKATLVRKFNTWHPFDHMVWLIYGNSDCCLILKEIIVPAICSSWCAFHGVIRPRASGS